MAAKTGSNATAKPATLPKVRGWTRILYMVLFIVALEVAEGLVYLIAVIQYIFAVASGQPNPRLAGFGDSLGAFAREVVCFLTYRSEILPFPWGPWPEVPKEVSAKDVKGPVPEDMNRP
mgnify:CR=1 FL=1